MIKAWPCLRSLVSRLEQFEMYTNEIHFLFPLWLRHDMVAWPYHGHHKHTPVITRSKYISSFHYGTTDVIEEVFL